MFVGSALTAFWKLVDRFVRLAGFEFQLAAAATRADTVVRIVLKNAAKVFFSRFVIP